MTPTQYIQQRGLHNLAQVTALTGISRQTLSNWYHNRKRLFDIVVTGCIATLKKEETDENS